ncbi:MAG: single-stranded-DNA-specific exonuclease RecJ [Bdellovibrionales bacterium RIFOXYD12_FULL_39_22]|nr:MAG: single-stranded-DNA-specific exonuclease RecJ [Bdellovibrionales bacterium RIFOXYB1_FULL_39_21]OFZ41563.1 MAG: single-stranded-DNA-specific exonuclease RecJ [Bdellovibrionales bacterium RIFOXYC12_FULL_39_17]OFZ45876.1 MAG: single-stranded-DNA-specific exonuclease RecJ [Bdellovibrionales bacterium RIFOXYC1_FULL_39_130]OFZ71939.1 MAG: single-stranded-DNA-specific exonuclease RecJ [Bdellovibrionales bacterium RIFOXYC2_FULL_39_8]OFZ74808.1 MAG: single-stranded-DNA-specific exonuclease RecJ 
MANPSATSLTLHPVIRELFRLKNMAKKDVEEFLSWDLLSIPELVQLKGLPEASTRIIAAIQRGEKIGIYGDYDVDGTTSCALLFFFFKSISVQVEIIQPNRFDDGYGLHSELIDRALEYNIGLLITVDCGITNTQAADHAREKKLDLIITDHHQDIAESMPWATAIVNPNRRDETCHQHLKGLAGVGVAFALALQIKNDWEKAFGKKCPPLYPLLQFVAVGTICDMAPLNTTNLRLARHGIKLLKNSEYPGLRVFITAEERAWPMLPSEKLSFNIGPLINAKGRLEDAACALKLLTADNPEDGRRLYQQLENCNDDRKFIQSKIFKEAKEQIRREMINGEQNISIVYDPNWHEGVIGIVASKLVEEFKVPAIVFANAKEEGLIKGSARSAGELNLLAELNKVSDLFTKYGGHRAAAGMTLPKDKFHQLYLRMNSSLSTIPRSLRTIADQYDLEIKASDVGPKLARDLELLEPFGVDNQRPVFKIRDIKLDSFEVMGEAHVRWNFSALDDPMVKLRGISFNYINKWANTAPSELFSLQNKRGASLEIYFNLGINRFKGNEYIQLQVRKIDLA